MPDTALPSWAGEMRDLFRSGSAAQFLLHGNVFDVVPHAGKLLSVAACAPRAAAKIGATGSRTRSGETPPRKR